MIDLIAGYADGFRAQQIRPFLASLRATQYPGRVLLFADGEAAKEARKYDVEVRPIPPIRMKVHSARFLVLQEAIATYDCEGVFLSDTRDVIFQHDPSESLPDVGIHTYEEDRSQTLGSCPYNSLWIRLGYGQDVLNDLFHYPISCVGTCCGDILSMRRYLAALRAEVQRLQPRTNKPQDQAAHNYLIRRGMSDDGIAIWPNEEGDVYTVGYVERGSIKTDGDKILSQDGFIPTVVHQWDRHSNLRTLVEKTWA